MENVYLIGLCRTPVGSFGGALKDVKAVELGKLVIGEALRRAKVDPRDVDEVFMGNVLQAGLGQNTARQAAVNAGIPVDVPASTINKVCGSGLFSVSLARRAIQAGDVKCVVAGGMESMSGAPFVMQNARWGARMGHTQLTDTMIHDGLWEAFNDYHMGMTAENVAEKYGITREMQDEYAALSQQRSCAARAAGAFKDEIVPVTIQKRKGESVVMDADEYIKEGVTAKSIARLKPAFKRDGGTVTAANASGINDGAAAMVVCSETFVEEHGLKPMLRICAAGSVGVDPRLMGMGPVPSVRKALDRAKLDVAQIDLFELNEAFAAQACAVACELGVDAQKVNVNGGAIAIGHPIGASGARILVTLAYEMEKRSAQYGVAALCIGGGMGEAIVVERV